MKSLCLVVLLAAAQAPQGFVHWRSADLKGYAKKLAPKIDANKVATEELGRWGNHWTLIAHREGDGEAELHETETDIFIPQTGEATLVIGGDVVDGRTTAPGQVRGKSIEGGVKVHLAPGDVVHIPAKTPHQVLLEKGKQFTYLVVKVETK